MTMTILLRRSRHSAAVLVSAMFSSVAFGQAAPTVPPRPAVSAPPAYTFPKIATQILPNGLRLAVVENHATPVVAVRVGLPAGATLDAPGKDGSWVLMMNSLREGTATRSAAEIADASADLGTAIALPSATAPNAAPAFTTARSMWQPALDLLADLLMHPAFPVDGVNRVQGLLASAARAASPALRVGRITNAQLFGVDHPAARFMTDSSVKRITRDDLIALHTAYLRPQNTTIVVTGDVTPAAARAAVEKAFSGWDRGGTTVESKAPATAPTIGQTTIFLSDQPNLPQSYIQTGELMPSRANSDAPANEIVDAILGSPAGSAGSRLMNEFRMKRGLTYTSNTALLWRPEPQPAMWRGAISVAAAVTDSAVIEWIRIIRNAREKQPVTAEELAFSRQNTVGKLQLSLESGAIADRTLSILQNGLPESFYTDYVRRMNSVTLPEAQAAAAKYFDPDHLVIAIVGDRAKIEAPLRATGIPVVIVDH